MGPILTLRAPSSARGASRGSFAALARGVVALVVLALLLGSGSALAESSSFTPVPNPPQQSRKSGQNMSAIMAGVGAGIAGAMCLMMMKQAQEAQDQNTKMMYMMMAAQECNQAAQSLANAKDNKDGAQTMTQPPSSGQQAAQAQAAPPAMNPTQAVAAAAPTDAPTDVPTFAPMALPTSGIVDQTAFDGEKGTDGIDVAKEPTKTGGAVVDGTTDLQAIPPAKVGFDETSTASNPVSTVGSGGAGVMALGGGSASASGTPSPGDGKNAGDGKGGAGRQAKAQAEAGQGGEGGGSGGNANGKPGNDALDAMIAQLMGGHGGDAGTLNMGATSGTLAVGAGKKAGEEELPNIFEYATFRYRELVDEDQLLFDGSIKAHKKGIPKAKPRAVAKADEKKTGPAVGAAPNAPALSGNRAPASSAPPALAAARASGNAASTDKTQAAVNARLLPTKVRMVGGLR